MKTINSVSFLAIGKTQETKESQGFKRYVGLASSHVLAVCPNKKELDELMGYESQNDPEYVKEDELSKIANITFIVRTDPDANNGVEITNRVNFTLRSVPAYNKDTTKVQVIDEYGNYTWADTELAKKGGKIEHAQKLGKYRIACVGECALVDFLKTYLNVPDAFEYKNGTWSLKPNGKAAEGVFSLEKIKDYFKGDFSELKEALALQPNNKIKLLYGVRTTDDGKQYQVIMAREGFVLNNNSGTSALARLEKNLTNLKNAGSMASTDFRVQELTEWAVEPSNFEATDSEESTTEELPW